MEENNNPLFSFFDSSTLNVIILGLLMIILVLSIYTSIIYIGPILRLKVSESHPKRLAADLMAGKYQNISKDTFFRYIRIKYGITAHNDYVVLLEETLTHIIDSNKDLKTESVKNAIQQLEGLIKEESEVKPYDGIEGEAKAFFEGISHLINEAPNQEPIKGQLHQLAKIFRNQSVNIKKNRRTNTIALAFSVIGIIVTMLFSIWGKSQLSESSMEAMKEDHTAEIDQLIEWMSVNLETVSKDDELDDAR